MTADLDDRVKTQTAADGIRAIAPGRNPDGLAVRAVMPMIALVALASAALLAYQVLVKGWWPGDHPDRAMGGFAVATWGRIGKILQYLGGLVAVLDIVGDKLLDNLSTMFSDNELQAQIRLSQAGPGPMSVIGGLLFVYYGSSSLLLRLAAKFVRSSSNIRTAGIVILTVGFVLDLAAS